ncbi:hypothetical protein [Rubinisphaera italica]|uniref:Uncharacterized protein n=1 Tax=Rubinisphaera italica TaxID=2527969 RepID=A0A5C5XB30_9PLAN|nr:hypothetical protein [Rubinisphaera italica]TWT59395.1 hypothetical protein Pan54_00960 [Rubinisphaera italica]
MPTQAPEIEPQADITRPTKRRRMIRAEWGVLLIVLVTFLALESVFRFRGEILSKDIAHLNSFEQISRELAEAAQPNELRTLFLGNSLTRYGIDQELFTQIVADDYDLTVKTVKMNPDNTALADWFYAYQTYFKKAGRPPEVMIVGFEGNHLRDAPSNHLDRLAYYYGAGNDPEDLGRFDLKTLEQKISFQLCRVSAAMANRDRLQRRVLDQVIPQYREGMDQLNGRLQIATSASPKVQVSYERLLKFIALAEQDDVQVILVAMPVPEYYEFDSALLEVVSSTSAQLIDCRLIPGLTNEMFFDGLHMDEQASRIYTTALAEKIGLDLKSMPARQFAQFP